RAPTSRNTPSVRLSTQWQAICISNGKHPAFYGDTTLLRYTGRRKEMHLAPTIITFSHLRWDFVYQRPQHLLSRLAGRHRVIFIEERIGMAESPDWQFTRPEPDVLVCRPRTPSSAPGFASEQLPHLRKLVRQLIEQEHIEDYVLWFYTPMAFPLAEEL